MLIQRNGDHDEDRREESRRLAKAAEEGVERAGRDEQQDHRLANDLDRDRGHSSTPRFGKLVEPVALLPPANLRLREAGARTAGRLVRLNQIEPIRRPERN